MLIIHAFQQRYDGIFVEQEPQTEPKYERSQNLSKWETFIELKARNYENTHEKYEVEEAQNVLSAAWSDILPHFYLDLSVAPRHRFRLTRFGDGRNTRQVVWGIFYEVLNDANRCLDSRLSVLLI